VGVLFFKNKDMSRPIKQGLDYFPLDVDTDDKVELIEAKHGIVGFGVIIKLYQKIYKEGYYLNWNEETSLLFSKRINVNINIINDVITDCLQYNLLDKTLFNTYKILTSEGIQKRYLGAVERRKEVFLCKKYINVDIKKINVNINWINNNNSTQSKVKESKVKKKPSESVPFKKDFIDQIVDCFAKRHGDYTILNSGKERAAAGKILTQYKKQCPNQTTEETLQGLGVFFHQCINIQDPWLHDNMSLPIIVSQYNTIIKILKNGKTGKQKGASPNEIANAIAKNFAIDYTSVGGEYVKDKESFSDSPC
jgi:hypothetical protein